MEHNPILISGTGSGLGKHLHDHFKGVAFSRGTPLTEVLDQAKQQPFTAIIHAAFNPRQDISSSNLQSYLDDTILLTKKLLQVPHHYFIFISSGDVYPKNDEPHLEDEDIKLKEVDSIYGLTKLISESLVQENARDFLILRPTALLGQYARRNSLTRILLEENISLTLSEQSTFNYILHSDVAEFIEKALSLRLTGTYNIAASSNISLGEVAQFFKRPVQFGNYTYRTGNIRNDKAVSFLPGLMKTSLENINLYKGL